MSAVWSFCARCLDVISPGNQSDGVAKCRLFCALRPWDISLSGSILQLARVAKSDKKNTAFCLKYIYISSRFFKTNLTKSAVIWVKSCQNAGFLRPISSKITPTKEKERWKSKSKERERRRREKTMVALLVFIMDTFFGRKKKLLDGRGLFGDNVFKNPARYILRS